MHMQISNLKKHGADRWQNGKLYENSIDFKQDAELLCSILRDKRGIAIGTCGAKFNFV